MLLGRASLQESPRLTRLSTNAKVAMPAASNTQHGREAGYTARSRRSRPSSVTDRRPAYEAACPLSRWAGHSAAESAPLLLWTKLRRSLRDARDARSPHGQAVVSRAGARTNVCRPIRAPEPYSPSRLYPPVRRSLTVGPVSSTQACIFSGDCGREPPLLRS
jgi:hypothetical protein